MAKHWCDLGEGTRCQQCGTEYGRHNVVRRCPHGAARQPGESIRLTGRRVSYRARTAEEIESALLICIACEHRTAEGLCGLLKREGCGSCRSIADFSAKLRRGMGCPDGRFPATELVEPTKTQSVEHPHPHESPYSLAKSDEPSPS